MEFVFKPKYNQGFLIGYNYIHRCGELAVTFGSPAYGMVCPVCDDPENERQVM